LELLVDILVLIDIFKALKSRLDSLGAAFLVRYTEGSFLEVKFLNDLIEGIKRIKN
jgi:hypothetical protein